MYKEITIIQKEVGGGDCSKCIFNDEDDECHKISTLQLERCRGNFIFIIKESLQNQSK